MDGKPVFYTTKWISPEQLSRKTGIARHPTFDAAESAARRIFARGGDAGIFGVYQNGDCCDLAEIKDDALGRVWTILNYDGALLV